MDLKNAKMWNTTILHKTVLRIQAAVSIKNHGNQNGVFQKFILFRKLAHQNTKIFREIETTFSTQSQTFIEQKILFKPSFKTSKFITKNLVIKNL